MPALDRKERDRRLRETDILNAAEIVFATKGYHKATVLDIAKEAQYAVGTIYLYFKNKQVLYVTLIEKKTKDLFNVVKEKVEGVKGSYEKLKLLIETQLGYLKENEDFFRIYFSERASLRGAINDKLLRQIMSHHFKYLDYITTLIEKAQRDNIIRKDLEPKRMAYTLAAMLNAAVFPTWLKSERVQKEDLDKLSGSILDIFLNGAGAKR